MHTIIINTNIFIISITIIIIINIMIIAISIIIIVIIIIVIIIINIIATVAADCFKTCAEIDWSSLDSFNQHVVRVVVVTVCWSYDISRMWATLFLEGGPGDEGQKAEVWQFLYGHLIIISIHCTFKIIVQHLV